MKLRFNAKLIALALITAFAVNGVNAGGKDADQGDKKKAERAEKAGYLFGGLSRFVSSETENVRLKELNEAFDKLQKNDKNVKETGAFKWDGTNLVAVDSKDEANAFVLTEERERLIGAHSEFKVVLDGLQKLKAENPEEFSKGESNGIRDAERAKRSHKEAIVDFMWNDRSKMGRVGTIGGSVAGAMLLLAAFKSYSEFGTLAKTHVVLKQWASNIYYGLAGNPEGRGYDKNISRGVVGGAVAVAAVLAGTHYMGYWGGDSSSNNSSDNSGDNNADDSNTGDNS